MTNNHWFVQYLADLCNIPVVVAKNKEATAWGVALMGWLQLNEYDTIEQIQAKIQHQHVISPSMPKASRETQLCRWKKALQATLTWHC